MQKITRRSALRALARSVLFGGLGMLAVSLAGRAGASAHREAPCSGGGRFGACPALDGCGLPRGLSARSQVFSVRCSVFGKAEELNR